MAKAYVTSPVVNEKAKALWLLCSISLNYTKIELRYMKQSKQKGGRKEDTFEDIFTITKIV